MESVRAVIEYNYAEELGSFLETVDDDNEYDTGHIFLDILRLSAYLDGDERPLGEIVDEIIKKEL